MTFGFNQPEIDSIDQHVWRNERQKLYNTIQDFCNTDQISFTTDINEKTVVECNSEKIVYMQLFDLIPELNYWVNIDLLLKQHGKICFVLTDNVLKFNDLECVKFFSCPKLLGVTASYTGAFNPNTQPTKLYNCFIQRTDSVRQSWFYFLHNYDLLDKGHVSFLGKQLDHYSQLTGKELFDYIHSTYKLGELPHFQSAYLSLKDIVPYRNFKENNDLTVYINDSKYSLILETCACEDDLDQWCFTEKLLRAIQSPTYVLPFCQKGSIEILKSLGFELNLNLEWLDHLPWQQRQQKLLDFLICDQIEYNQKFLQDISQHNQNLLQSWKSQYQKPDFFKDFFEKLSST